MSACLYFLKKIILFWLLTKNGSLISLIQIYLGFELEKQKHTIEPDWLAAVSCPICNFTNPVLLSFSLIFLRYCKKD